LQLEEFEPCLKWWRKREENERAWRVKVEDVLKYDKDSGLVSVNLDIKNPKGKADLVHLPPEQLVEDILKKEEQILRVLNDLRQTLRNGSS